jgi:hypothetical protein
MEEARRKCERENEIYDKAREGGERWRGGSDYIRGAGFVSTMRTDLLGIETKMGKGPGR